METILEENEVIIPRHEANFDRACDEVYRYALMYFQIDDCGHSLRVKDWERNCCNIRVTFIGYSMTINNHTYKFKVEAVKYID